MAETSAQKKKPLDLARSANELIAAFDEALRTGRSGVTPEEVKRRDEYAKAAEAAKKGVAPKTEPKRDPKKAIPRNKTEENPKPPQTRLASVPVATPELEKVTREAVAQVESLTARFDHGAIHGVEELNIKKWVETGVA